MKVNEGAFFFLEITTYKVVHTRFYKIHIYFRTIPLMQPCLPLKNKNILDWTYVILFGFLIFSCISSFFE